MSKNTSSLIYVWDPYCGWCYGFSKSIQALHENHPELPLTILSGGLFTGDRKKPISTMSYIEESNKRITDITGAKFGEKYQDLIDEGSFIMDSDMAAKGFSTLRFFAPERAYYLASAMSQAFYNEGKSLSDPNTYREIAIANNLNPDDVVSRFESEISTKDANSDFIKTRELGVHSYPTLILKKDDKFIELGVGDMNLERLEKKLKSI
ncbi:DsbA family protein [Peptostreptococcus faecalis]|uniref:DsbA family protein n=1 Tax=Peptostreptococcus faecalis TaxID=2045015 RepID=UPI000C7BCCED|nr:DsbA family protein [Peptostreptococcus faecalis]